MLSGLSGMSSSKSARQANSFGAEFPAHQTIAGAGRVAFVEDEIEHGLYSGKAFGQGAGIGDLVGNACLLNLALGANKALCKRSLRNQKSAGDLRCGESAKSS